MPRQSPADERVTQVHVGRQPMFDAGLTIRAHELLFRAHPTSTAARVSPDAADEATTTVILNTFTAFDLRTLVGDRLAFVNLTRPFIVGDLPVPFAPELAVLELLETVPADPQVLAGVRRLRAAGFAVALDDFTCDQPGRRELLAEVDHVKLDIDQIGADHLAGTVAGVRRFGARIVVERVETAEQLELCRSLEVELVQGYYLLRPETLTATTLHPSRVSCLDLLRRLSDPDLSFDELEQLVQRDAALTYRLLRATNAAATGSRRRLESVRDALVMLGTGRLRAWVMLLVAADVHGGPAQLSAAVTTARTCELLAVRHRVRPDVAFTAGLISRLDVVLGVGLPDLLDALHLSEQLRGAVTAGRGRLGELLTTVREYESGGSTAPGVPEAYLAALAWADATVVE